MNSGQLLCCVQYTLGLGLHECPWSPPLLVIRKLPPNNHCDSQAAEDEDDNHVTSMLNAFDKKARKKGCLPNSFSLVNFCETLKIMLYIKG